MRRRSLDGDTDGVGCCWWWSKQVRDVLIGNEEFVFERRDVDFEQDSDLGKIVGNGVIKDGEAVDW